jgi:hypothetical protein
MVDTEAFEMDEDRARRPDQAHAPREPRGGSSRVAMRSLIHGVSRSHGSGRPALTAGALATK